MALVSKIFKVIRQVMINIKTSMDHSNNSPIHNFYSNNYNSLSKILDSHKDRSQTRKDIHKCRQEIFHQMVCSIAT